MRFYIYDRVPLSGTQSNYYASSTGFSPYNPRVGNWGDLNNPSTQTNATPGEVIVGLRIECTGYNCGFSGGNDNDVNNVLYVGGRPSNLVVVGQPPQLCRNTTYTLQWAAAFQASGYDVDFGSSGIAPVSTTATSVQFTVPNTVLSTGGLSIPISVTARSCGAASRTSATSLLTLPVAQPVAVAQNMTLSNGLCPTTTGNFKVVEVDKGNPSGHYRWTVSSNAIVSGPIENSLQNTLTISTPQPGAVTVSVQKRASLTDCGGYGAPVSKTFQIAYTNPLLPTGATLTRCTTGEYILALQGAQPGLSYSYQSYNVLPAGSITFASPANGPSATVARVPDANGVSPTQFGLIVSVVSPCAAPGTAANQVWVNTTPLTFPSKSFPCSPVMGPRLAAPPTLYPNPTTGQVAIAKEATTAYAWAKVMDAQGQLKQEQRATLPQGITSLDVSALPAGIYLVQLFDGQRLTTQRLVKE